MLLVIPSIGLQNHHCIDCICGEAGTEPMYNAYSYNPYKLSRLLRRENAKSLHIIDYDSFEYKKINRDEILTITHSIDIPVNLEARFGSIQECGFFLKNEIYRVILSREAIENPDGVKELIKKYTVSRIVFSLKVNNRIAYFKDLSLSISDSDYINTIKSLGISRLIYCDETWMASEDGPDYELLRRIAIESGIKITLFECINNPRQLWELDKLTPFGVDSVILGKSLYENKYPCQKIWRLIEAKVEPKIQ